MDVKAQAAQPLGGYFTSSFDARLRAALAKVKGISMAERIKLYNGIIDACHQQVEDCCEGLSAATFLQLHELYGFGPKRLKRLRDSVQETIDNYAAKYDVGTICALQRDLRAAKIFLAKEDGNGAH